MINGALALLPIFFWAVTIVRWPHQTGDERISLIIVSSLLTLIVIAMSALMNIETPVTLFPPVPTPTHLALPTSVILTP